MKWKTDIINWFGKEYGYTSFLEISTSTTGNRFDQVDSDIFIIKECLNYKVDILSHRKRNIDHNFPILNYDEHLIRIGDKKFDVILVDSFHTFEQSAKDIYIATQLLAKNGVIIIHDCNPMMKRLIGEYHKGPWCGQTYEAFIQFHLANPTMEIATVDIDHGCGIIRPDITVNSRFTLKNSSRLKKWNFFDKNRKGLLNLITVDQFVDFYKPTQ